MTPAITHQAAEVHCRAYVNRHRAKSGESLPVTLDELLAECRAQPMFARLTTDQLMHALRWKGWTVDDDEGGLWWRVPEGVSHG